MLAGLFKISRGLTPPYLIPALWIQQRGYNLRTAVEGSMLITVKPVHIYMLRLLLYQKHIPCQKQIKISVQTE